jgi:hypothetical protein
MHDSPVPEIVTTVERTPEYVRTVYEVRCWFCDGLFIKIMHHVEVVNGDPVPTAINHKIFAEGHCRRCKKWHNQLVVKI